MQFIKEMPPNGELGQKVLTVKKGKGLTLFLAILFIGVSVGIFNNLYFKGISYVNVTYGTGIANEYMYIMSALGFVVGIMFLFMAFKVGSGILDFYTYALVLNNNKIFYANIKEIYIEKKQQHFQIYINTQNDSVVYKKLMLPPKNIEIINSISDLIK